MVMRTFLPTCRSILRCEEQVFPRRVGRAAVPALRAACAGLDFGAACKTGARRPLACRGGSSGVERAVGTPSPERSINTHSFKVNIENSPATKSNVDNLEVCTAVRLCKL